MSIRLGLGLGLQYSCRGRCGGSQESATIEAYDSNENLIDPVVHEDGTKFWVFTDDSGTLKVDGSPTVDILLVGGGGGGGGDGGFAGYSGGGGGGGRAVEVVGVTLDNEAYTIARGGGGAEATNGGSSSLYESMGDDKVLLYRANGGGGGGIFPIQPSNQAKNGGSGGGGTGKGSVNEDPTESGILHNGYYYHIFEADGELEVLADVDVEILLVGGGGGNGSTYSDAWGTGAGGAGGVIEGTQHLTAGIYPITVGIGGAPLANGSNTVAFTKTAIGGGSGGKRTNIAPSDGGSGGGAPSWFKYTPQQPVYPGGAAETGQGNKGGDGDISETTTHRGSQGGGGYGSQGIDRLTARAAGLSDMAGTNGGLGKLLSDIFAGLGGGANIGLTFDGVAGGGGGSARSDDRLYRGFGGGGENNPYGAGDGGYYNTSPTPAIDGTGSGAGGASGVIDEIEGRSCGKGGDGIVIVRYAV